jgi:hypothetical protein
MMIAIKRAILGSGVRGWGGGGCEGWCKLGGEFVGSVMGIVMFGGFKCC